MLFPYTVAGIFTSNDILREYTAFALRLYMAAGIVFCAQIACQFTLIALGDAKSSIFLAVLRKLILLISLIYIMPHIIPGSKASAVYLAEPIADIIAVITTVTLFNIQFKKRLTLISSKNNV